MSSSKNLEYKKTSFLNKSNSDFIEQMYLKFINKDSDLPESWKNYFKDTVEEIDLITKEINGPSWSPVKKKIHVDQINNKKDKASKTIETLNLGFFQIFSELPKMKNIRSWTIFFPNISALLPKHRLSKFRGNFIYRASENTAIL